MSRGGGGVAVAADNLVPGDPVQRTITLTRAGETEAFGSVRLTTTGGVAQRAVLGSEIDLAAATETMNSSSAASNLRVQLTLPGDVDNTVQGLSNVVTFTFDATQRNADFR